MSKGRVIAAGWALALAGLLAFAPPVSAQFGSKPPVVGKVQSLQLPVWVERGGVKASVKAGWAIYAGDRITTGADGRIEFAIVGDARLKVGGDAHIEFTDAMAAAEDAGSLLRISRGSFLFAAPTVARPEGTQLLLGADISATLYGGQVWGRAEEAQDLVVLLQGDVVVRGPNFDPARLTEADTTVAIPRGGKANPPVPVAKGKLAMWLAAVEPVAGKPSLKADGQWDVSLGSGYKRQELEELACAMQNRGIPSEISEVRETGKQTWYRVVVRRFATRNDAIGFARTGKNYGAADAWVLLPQT